MSAEGPLTSLVDEETEPLSNRSVELTNGLVIGRVRREPVRWRITGQLGYGLEGFRLL